jgi:hypothetical protein
VSSRSCSCLTSLLSSPKRRAGVTATPSCRFKDAHTRHPSLSIHDHTLTLSLSFIPVPLLLETYISIHPRLHLVSFCFRTASATPLPHRFAYNNVIRPVSTLSHTTLLFINTILYYDSALSRIKLYISHRHHPYSPSPSNMTYGVPQPRMTSMDLRVGGKYRIGKKIGSGSFGTSPCSLCIIH